MKCQILTLLVAAGVTLAQVNAPYSEAQLRDVNDRYGSAFFETINPTGTNVLLQNQVIDPSFDNFQQEQWLTIYDNTVGTVPPQTCGNGIVEGFEYCDVLQPFTPSGPLPTCGDLGYNPVATSGDTNVACNYECSYDQLGINNYACSGSALPATCPAAVASGHNCGNCQLDAGEQCDYDADGNVLTGGATCESVGLGFTTGILGCRKYLGSTSHPTTCQYDFSQCRRTTPGCGNGIVEGVEQCDPPGALVPCETIGLTTGLAGTGLICSPTCDWDTGYCDPAYLNLDASHQTRDVSLGGATALPPQCGNNVIDVPEQCDNGNLQGATCETLGYATGTLVCTGCRYDLRGCAAQGGLVTVVAVGPEVTRVEVGDVVAIAANETCIPFALNNFNTDRSQYCIVDETDIAVTLQEGNLFFDKSNFADQAGWRNSITQAGDWEDRSEF